MKIVNINKRLPHYHTVAIFFYRMNDGLESIKSAATCKTQIKVLLLTKLNVLIYTEISNPTL